MGNIHVPSSHDTKCIVSNAVGKKDTNVVIKTVIPTVNLSTQPKVEKKVVKVVKKIKVEKPVGRIYKGKFSGDKRLSKIFTESKIFNDKKIPKTIGALVQIKGIGMSTAKRIYRKIKS